jgi:epoxyqueuosine reductase
MRRGQITVPRRCLHAVHHGIRSLLQPVLGNLWDPERLAWAARVPVLPERLRRHHRAKVWRAGPREAPEDLRSVRGIWRDPEAEERAFEERPLHAFFQIHPKAAQDMLLHGWEYLLPTAPRYMRALEKVRGARRANKKIDAAGKPPLPLTPAERSARLRAEAARIGLSTVGFAPYDRKYSWEEFAPRHEKGSVIVAVYEQDFESTQTAPSARAERAAFFAYSELMERASKLAETVQEMGGKAQPHGPVGEALVIHYGVRAGLGQLGLNGQLLTPEAGSRARILLITTNLELEHDEPKDFGVHAICDACQVCARRCPVGAIPIKRAEYRGVVKAKIKTERCFPVVARVEGCAICMKTCPVQRYGLDRVVDHFEQSGEILGKGSDELEGFDWPLDGRRYGPGEKPDVGEASLVNPPGWEFDVRRVQPGAEPTESDSAPLTH